MILTSPLTDSSNITSPMDPVVSESCWPNIAVTLPDPIHSGSVLPSYPIVTLSNNEFYSAVNGIFSDNSLSKIPFHTTVTHAMPNSPLSLSPSSSSSSSPFSIVSTVSSPNKTRPKLVLPIPEIPSRLDKRCKGGPGKRRKGLSDEERQARRDERIVRNRIAAQESRTKKRAYVETLEVTTMELLMMNQQLKLDNNQLTKRVKILEEQNVALNQKLDWVMTQLANINGTTISPTNQFHLSTSIPVVSVPTTVPVPLCQPVSDLNQSIIPLPNCIPLTVGNDMPLLNNVTSGSIYPQKTVTVGGLDGVNVSTVHNVTPIPPIQSTPITFPLLPSHVTTTYHSSNPLSLSDTYSSLTLLNQQSYESSVGFSGPAASGKLSFSNKKVNSLQWRPTYLIQSCLQIMTITKVLILTWYSIMMNLLIILTNWGIWVTLMEIVDGLTSIHKLMLEVMRKTCMSFNNNFYTSQVEGMNRYHALHVNLMAIPFTCLLLTRHYTLVHGPQWMADNRPP